MKFFDSLSTDPEKVCAFCLLIRPLASYFGRGGTANAVTERVLF